MQDITPKKELTMMNLADGETVSCALIGHPAAHSLSPALHNTLAKLTGVNMVYTTFDVTEDALEDAIRGAYKLGFKGLTISVPYKESVAKYLTGLGPTASRVGAVNTLVRSADGKGFEGHNTDLKGMKRSMKSYGFTEHLGRSAIVIGAGSIARSLCFLLAMEGAGEIYILNRTVERARELAKDVTNATGYDKIRVLPLSDYTEIPTLEGQNKYLCFQCTNVGMYPNTEETVIDDPAFFAKLGIVLDAVYRPGETLFLKKAKAAGAKTGNGQAMLLYQGVEAFETWFGVHVSDEIIEKTGTVMQERFHEKKTIILIGFMGTGKTTVSRELATRMEEKLVSSDAEIERRLNTTISDIKAVRGEGALRATETRILREVLNEKTESFILLTGSDAPLSEENRVLMHDMGTVIYLKTSPAEIVRRMYDGDEERAAEDEIARSNIEAILEEREQYYRLAADHTIVTDNKTPEVIADEILEKVFAA